MKISIPLNLGAATIYACGTRLPPIVIEGRACISYNLMFVQ
jgi:hypothetical protein